MKRSNLWLMPDSVITFKIPSIHYTNHLLNLASVHTTRHAHSRKDRCDFDDPLIHLTLFITTCSGIFLGALTYHTDGSPLPTVETSFPRLH